MLLTDLFFNTLIPMPQFRLRRSSCPYTAAIQLCRRMETLINGSRGKRLSHNITVHYRITRNRSSQRTWANCCNIPSSMTTSTRPLKSHRGIESLKDTRHPTFCVTNYLDMFMSEGKWINEVQQQQEACDLRWWRTGHLSDKMWTQQKPRMIR